MNMFLSDSPKIVLYLKSDGLQLYQEGVEGSETLTFPKDAFNSQEIKDRTKIEESVLDFLLHLSIKKQHVLFVLSDEIILKESFSKTDSEIEESIKSYLEKLPFGQKKATYLKIDNKQEVQLIVTNKDLYESVGDVFEKLGWEIRSLIPAFLLGITESSALTEDEVRVVIKNYKKVAQGDFIYQEVNDLNSNFSKNHSEEPIFFSLTAVLVAILVAIVFSGGYLAVRFFKIELPKSRLELIPEPSIATTALNEQESSPSSQAIPQSAKETLQIKILNGSGVRGQAATLQEQFKSMGYKNIEVGNADNESDTTSVVFSNNVSQSIQDEIINQLKQMFKEVDSNQKKDAGTIDVSVLTGKNVIQ